MTAIVVVLISMLINRVAAIALSLTGMSHEEARFQARAAMSGVGLTTRTPEDIVAHPVRRRIVFTLMIVGSAGLVTAVASLVLSFRGGSADQRLVKAGYFLDLSGDYAVAELQIQTGDWVANGSLRELRLRDEGVVVMGIHRPDEYLGAPRPDTVLLPGDTLVVYGREARIAELDRRRHNAGGDAAHARASAEEMRIAGGPQRRRSHSASSGSRT
jgi:hypothetical protein